MNKNLVNRYAGLTGIFITLGLLISVSCRPGKQNQGEDATDYTQSIRDWHAKRLERLKRPDGWLSLVGLYWLKEGENSFGGHEDNDFVIRGDVIPERLGVFIRKGELVRFRAEAEVKIGTRETVLEEEIAMKPDDSGNPTILKWGSLSWFIIKRGNRLGIRLRDAKHPRIQEFPGIEMFPIDPRWRISASFEKYDPARKIEVPNVLGSTETQLCEGVLVFEYKNRTHRLEATGAGKNLFIVFGDSTNARETYGGGRFLVVTKPDGQGSTWVDFNMAFNPPCVFSPHATCPLPRQENRLPFQVLAGEKMVHGFHD